MSEVPEEALFQMTTYLAKANEDISRLKAEVERLLAYAVRDGLLSECWVYDQDQALVDAFLT